MGLILWKEVVFGFNANFAKNQKQKQNNNNNNNNNNKRITPYIFIALSQKIVFKLPQSIFHGKMTRSSSHFPLLFVDSVDSVLVLQI